MADLDAIFKAYDVRGVFPEEIDAQVALAVGAAFADLMRSEDPEVSSIVVGRDMRPSGVELTAAFTDGVTSRGLDVIRVGLASTDMLYYASGTLGAPGAVFTASHNPARYNGIKMCRAGAAPIGEDTGLRDIKALVVDGLTEAAGGEAANRGSVSDRDMLEGFAEHVRGFVDHSKLRPLKVVADTANGMGGLVVPAVFTGLPFELEVLFGELDGTFPNHPADPIDMDNLRDLQSRVLETQADVGLAFDGDADRVFLVDELAQPISGSLTTAIVASGLLDKHPGATVIHNLICSKVVPEVVTEQGGTPVRSRVGHSFIKAKMAETDAVFAGEHSGHYYFRDNFRADSGLIAALVILEQLSESELTLSELCAPFRRYAASGEINTVVDDPQAVIDRLAEHFSDLDSDRLDGLTVDSGDWWFNVRASNTEPLLRLNLEAPTQSDVRARTSEVQAVMTARG